MGTAVIEWADFSGGHFVGNRDTQQPANTWVGDNVWIDRTSGEIMPMPRVARLTSDTYTNTPVASDEVSYPIRTNTGAVVWAQHDDVTHWRWFRRDWASSGANYTQGTVTSSAQFNGDASYAGQVPAFGQFGGALHAWIVSTFFANLQRLNISAMTTGATAVTAGNRIARWNERMVSWVWPSGSRLYFSDAAAFTTWGSTSFYDIGDDAAINAVIVSAQSLLIGKASGWWEIRGTLGSTATIQQIVVGNGPGSEWGLALSGGAVLYGAPQLNQTALGLLGLVARPLNARQSSADQTLKRPSLSGLIVGADQEIDPSAGTGRLYGRGWMYDTVASRWFRYHIDDTTLNPPTGNGITMLKWCTDVGDTQDVFTGVEPIYGIINSSGLARNEVVAFDDLFNRTPPADKSCTVTLAEHRSPTGSIEAVKEVWLELTTGPTINVGIATATLRVGATGAPDAGIGAEAPYSQSYTWERHSSELAASSRYMVRFQPTDLPDAMAFVPEVTLTNCRLRRVILVVDRNGIRAS